MEENEKNNIDEKIEEVDKLEPYVVTENNQQVELKNSEEPSVQIASEGNNKNNKKGKGLKVFVIIFIVLLLAGGAVAGYFCFFAKKGDSEGGSIKTKSTKVYSTYTLKSNSLENFDLAFLKLDNSKKNKVYSPLSIKYALQMLSEGADGNTKKELDNVIGEYKTKKYENNSNMSFANAMFIRNDFKDNIKKNYTDNLKNKYNAEVVYDDFNSASNMNKWVSDKTFNLINNLLSDDKVKQENFTLINALAIDMEWNKKLQATCANVSEGYSIYYNHEKYSQSVSTICSEHDYSTLKFDNIENVQTMHIAASINNYDIVKTLGEDNIRKTVGEEYKKWLETDEGKREVANGSTEADVNKYLDGFIKELNSNYKRVDNSTDFSLYTDEDVKVFAKDLKEYNGTTLQYVAIMPVKDNLDSYLEKTDAAKINNIVKNLKSIKNENFTDGKVTQIEGYIPTFKYEYTLDLLNDLKKIGVSDVFDINKADLSNMLDKGQKQYIGDATHKANIEFSNEGIKAAAATALGGMGSTRGGFDYLYDVPIEKIELKFNKPYMYIIRDKKDGEVWFVGTVYEPNVHSMKGQDADK